jgi:hypothetical protein
MQTAVRSGAAFAAVLIALDLPAAAAAQTELPPREFGIDAGVAFGIGDENTTSIGIPARTLRIGFYSSQTVSFEPYGGLTFEDAEGGDQLNVILGAGLLWHFAPPRAGTTLYLRPYADLNYLKVNTDSGEDDDDTRFGVGLGIGLKSPWRDRFATRLEGTIGYRTDPGTTEIGILAGLSFYTN